MMVRNSRWAFLGAMRYDLGLTQVYVAEVAQISQPYLSQVENGQVASPTLDTLAGLAVAFDVPLHHLLRRAGIDCGCSTYRDGAGKPKEVPA